MSWGGSERGNRELRGPKGGLGAVRGAEAMAGGGSYSGLGDSEWGLRGEGGLRGSRGAFGGLGALRGSWGGGPRSVRRWEPGGGASAARVLIG